MSDENEASLPDLAGVARPGLTTVLHPDPGGVADAVAAALQADVARDPQELQAALAIRVNGTDEAGREHDAIRRIVEAAEAGQTDRTVTDIDGLRRLARQLERAERIRTGTEARMAETIGRRLHHGSAVTVHPDAIRASAAEVQAARAATTSVRTEFDTAVRDAREAAAAAASAEESEESAERPAPTTATPERRGRFWDRSTATRRAVGGIVIAVAVAIAFVVATAGELGFLTVLVLVLPALAVAWGLQVYRDAADDAEDKATASSYLAGVSARTDAVYHDPNDGDEPGGSAVARLMQGRLDLAIERERTTLAAWHDLVGTDADPDDLDTVLRERDPQYFRADELVAETPQARAAAAHLRRIQAAWRVAWAALDRDPPAASEAEAQVAELSEAGVAVATVARTAVDGDQLDALRAELAGGEETAVDRPLVIVDAETDDDFDESVIDGLAVAAASTTIVVLSAGQGDDEAREDDESESPVLEVVADDEPSA